MCTVSSAAIGFGKTRFLVTLRHHRRLLHTLDRCCDLRNTCLMTTASVAAVFYAVMMTPRASTSLLRSRVPVLHAMPSVLASTESLHKSTHQADGWSDSCAPAQNFAARGDEVVVAACSAHASGGPSACTEGTEARVRELELRRH